jgi:small subunit ribosomal protein S2
MRSEDVEEITKGGSLMSEEKVVLTEEEVMPTMEDVLPDENLPVITMKKLLEAGAHFGHQTKLWNPKMKPYIYGARNNVHIIDLEKTIVKIEEAYAALREIVTRGGKVLFVGTRKQHAEHVKNEAERSGSFYMNNRWLGGTLTNFRTISTRVKYLRDLEMQEVEGVFDRLPKKEAILIRKEMRRLNDNFEGIKEMRKVPEAVFVVSTIDEANAIREARNLNIPVFALVDTNCDPDVVDYVIPSNDDATKTVQLMLTLFADAIVEAKGGIPVLAYTRDLEPETETLEEALKHNEPRPRRGDGEERRSVRKTRTQHSDKPTRARKAEVKEDEEVVEEIAEEKPAPKAKVKKEEKVQTEEPKEEKAPKVKEEKAKVEKPKAEAKKDEPKEKVEKEPAKKAEPKKDVKKEVKKEAAPKTEAKEEAKVEEPKAEKEGDK